MTKGLTEKLLSLTILGFFILLSATAILNLGKGAESIEMLQTFNLDEGSGTWQLKQNVENRDFDPRGFYYYGYTYYTITHLFVKFTGWLGYATYDEGFLALSLRLVSFLCWLACGMLAFGIGRNLKWGSAMSAVLAAALCFLPKFYVYGQFVHPDTMQQLFCLAGLYGISRWLDWRGVLISAVCFGLAFGTKYSGIFLFPLSFLAIVYYWRTQQFELKHALVYGGLSLLLFFLAWYAFNPTFFSNLDLVRDDLNEQMGFVKRGNHQLESANPLLWIAVLHSQTSWILSSLLVGGLVLAGMAWKKSKTQKSDVMAWLILLVFVLGLTYLMVSVQMRRPRYMFHLIPLLLVPSFHFLEKSRQNWNPILSRLTLLYALIGLVFLGLGSMRSMNERSRPMENPRIQAGLWLEKNYGPENRIISDYYSYVPERSFPNSWHVFGMLREDVVNFDPSILIINKKLSGPRSWKREGTKFSDLDFVQGEKDQAREYLEFHNWLFSSASPFEVVYEVNDIVILEKAR
jgi:hypothetical protein